MTTEVEKWVKHFEDLCQNEMIMDQYSEGEPQETLKRSGI